MEGDLPTARAHLEDLVREIAAHAREETAARLALQDAKDALDANTKVVAELGSCAAGTTADDADQPWICTGTADVDATPSGAYAVFAAASETRDSVLAQQAFHDARKDWALDNLTPSKDRLEALKMKLNGILITAETDTSVTAMTSAGEVITEVVNADDDAMATIDLVKASVMSQMGDGVDMRVEKQGERLLNAKNACKVKAFDDAQEAREKAAEVSAARAGKITEVATQYARDAAFAPVDEQGMGVTNSLCNFGKPDGDGLVSDRVVCAEQEPPLCCGAAQRFLKDGTKLSIEICQPATRTTYEYYPALPADAVVAPTPETWRFQCISAAQKLAAAATAALAAGYMMA